MSQEEQAAFMNAENVLMNHIPIVSFSLINDCIMREYDLV